MSVNQSLATVSDHLFSGAIVAYSAGLFALCGDYAFGKSERRARARQVARERELVGAGAHDGAGTVAVLDEHDEATGVDTEEPAAPSVWGRRLGLLGFALAGLGLVLQVAALVSRGIATERIALGNMFEFASAICIFTVGTYLVLAIRKPSRRRLGVFVLPPVVFILVLIGLKFYTQARPVVPALRSYWLGIHVSAATIATGIFLVSAICTGLYLVKARHEAKERETGGYVPSRVAGNLPSSTALDRLAARTMTFAFPIWTFAIITGAIWAESAWGRYWGWDPKEIWSFISWVVYAVYLHARATAGWKGTRAAYINLLGAATMAFNFIVVNTVVSGLHSYSGL
ncbi:c-type cytochrome biogenesis protein CcsB [Blastococcus sp. Marseille-P5729]|uniref:c-type cytochrome biogenesis protein CcsB n=1 Tax=Blastococcus sp. Marseille-P5729 TaxID=2086582 RepID=UPI000D0ED437|nr:c-type cytochrome biogenesis protein CcsB [Blastococcus sp. Marseille-P5729]